MTAITASGQLVKRTVTRKSRLTILGIFLRLTGLLELRESRIKKIQKAFFRMSLMSSESWTVLVLRMSPLLVLNHLELLAVTPTLTR